jgi:hypothetical protein
LIAEIATFEYFEIEELSDISVKQHFGPLKNVIGNANGIEIGNVIAGGIVDGLGYVH